MNESNSGVNSKNSFCPECGSELQIINVFTDKSMIICSNKNVT